MIKYYLVFLGVMSLIAFISYGADKRKSKKQKWRTPEKILLSLGFFGGAIGAIFGMKAFRHKTKHWYFKYGMPAILIIQIITIALLSDKFFQ